MNAVDAAVPTEGSQARADLGERVGLPGSRGPRRVSLNPLRWPLTVRVLAGVVLGIVTGLILRGQSDAVRAAVSGELELVGQLVVRLLVMLATPLVFFAIVDAFATSEIGRRDFLRLASICLVNVSFAFVIGLLILNLFRPGETWQGQLEPLIEEVKAEQRSSRRERDLLTRVLVQKDVVSEEDLVLAEKQAQSLSPSRFVERKTPVSFVRAFVENDLLQVVILALLSGLALRSVRRQPGAAGAAAETTVSLVGTLNRMLMRMLQWIIQLVPLAVFGMLAKAVAWLGLGVFSTLWVFLVTILAGLATHALVYYSLAIWLWGGKHPFALLRRGGEAILTGLFTNSSLATMPLTLRCLTERLGVSEKSARLSACVGTNFNNDGITLYEAMAAVFLAQALGQDPSLGTQLGILVAALMAAVSITGIPEAGIIVLPLVLSAAGLDPAVVAGVLVLILPVDVILARVRSGVNVMGDMTVGILLDRGVGAGREPGPVQGQRGPDR